MHVTIVLLYVTLISLMLFAFLPVSLGDEPAPPSPDVAQIDLLRRLGLLLEDCKSRSPSPRLLAALRGPYSRSASSPSMHQGTAVLPMTMTASDYNMVSSPLSERLGYSAGGALLNIAGMLSLIYY